MLVHHMIAKVELQVLMPSKLHSVQNAKWFNDVHIYYPEGKNPQVVWLFTFLKGK